MTELWVCVYFSPLNATDPKSLKYFTLTQSTVWLCKQALQHARRLFVTSFYILACFSKSCPIIRHGGAWVERRYSSYSFSTSALDGGEWSASRPGRAFAPEKGTPVPIVQEAGWAPEPVWTQRLEEKSICQCRGSNLDRPVVQPVARHCTAWATRLTACFSTNHYYIFIFFLLVSCENTVFSLHFSHLYVQCLPCFFWLHISTRT
jgi:hypothetical protein